MVLITKKYTKIKYQIFQFYDNCKIYEIAHIPTYFSAFHLFLNHVHGCLIMVV